MSEQHCRHDEWSSSGGDPFDELDHARAINEIILVVYDDVQLLDFSGPLQTFDTANERHEATKAASISPYPTYQVSLVSTDGGAVRTSSGVIIETDPLPVKVSSSATVIIAGGHGVNAACKDPSLLSWLKQNGPEAKRLCSVCTGAILLAHAGFLDNKEATTHWSYCKEFQKRFPRVNLKPDAIYTSQDNVWTSAGITAGIDLALALIQEDWDAGVANATAQWLVVHAKRAGGQSQFSDILEIEARDAEGVFYELHEWIGADLSRALNLRELAEQAGMSERSFSRRYKQVMGISPARAVRLFRAQRAKDLLRSTNASFKLIARQSGFASVEQMNSSLSAVYGASAKLIRNTSRRD